MVFRGKDGWVLCYSALILQDKNSNNFDDFLEKILAQGRSSGKDYLRIFPGTMCQVWTREFNSEQSGTPSEIASLPLLYGYLDGADRQSGKSLSTYNARLENIHSSRLWNRAIEDCRGVVVSAGFYEWVSPKELIKSGMSDLTKISEYFEKKLAAKKVKADRDGKPFKISANEKKPVLERKVGVFFGPPEEQVLLFPVLARKSKDIPGGFAIITTTASKFIRDAGHDRRPIALDREAVQHWFENEKEATLIELLKDAKPPVLEIALA